MRPLVALVLLAAFCIAAHEPGDETAKQDGSKLNGTWVLVRAEMDGVVMPKEALENSILKIDGTRHTLRMGEENLDGTHRFDPTQDPKAYDLTIETGLSKGEKRQGIYRLEGDELTLCSAGAGKARPKEFSAAKGTDQTLTVWKREAK